MNKSIRGWSFGLIVAFLILAFWNIDLNFRENKYRKAVHNMCNLCNTWDEPTYRPSSIDGKCVTVTKQISPVTLTCDMCPPDGRVYIDR